ncbi:rod shape-determining protein RodA [Hufsiella ginkgonis]|uniref:Cell wall polymerase n=1 Tax=Hufsiella ginkgonis TaxID=2695274 RepID=A0A7K1XV04_9SPHI|nr:rod shape-determining protein RodA [Hufsiella ginkgonis]
MNNQRSLFFNVDWVTVLLIFALMSIGLLNIHSAVFDPLHPDLFDSRTSYGRQFIFIISSMVIGLVILLLDSKFFNAASPIFYGITIFMLVLVLLIGRNIGGNQAWISIGSFGLQPSEFAKFATCLLLARYLSASTTKVQDLKTQLSCAAIIIVPVVLILRQPDVGSALVFTSLIFVLYREGLPGYFLVAELVAIVLFVLTLLYNKFFVLGGVVALAAFLFYQFKRARVLRMRLIIGTALSIGYVFCVDFAYTNVLQPHHRKRIDVILGKINDPRNEGYNLNQSKIAIGSGQLWGKGYMQGTQTRYDFVPEQSTDFIFCTIGEEWGFAGCFVVMGLYVFLLMRIIFIAERQRSAFTRIYAYGVASVIFFHFFINIGMTIGLVPVIGIPLPLISYGGSSLWAFTILLFIMLKLDSNRMGVL